MRTAAAGESRHLLPRRRSFDQRGDLAAAPVSLAGRTGPRLELVDPDGTHRRRRSTRSSRASRWRSASVTPPPGPWVYELYRHERRHAGHRARAPASSTRSFAVRRHARGQHLVSLAACIARLANGVAIDSAVARSHRSSSSRRPTSRSTTLLYQNFPEPVSRAVVGRRRASGSTCAARRTVRADDLRPARQSACARSCPARTGSGTLPAGRYGAAARARRERLRPAPRVGRHARTTGASCRRACTWLRSARRRARVDQEDRLPGPLMRLTTLGTGTVALHARARAARATSSRPAPVRCCSTAAAASRTGWPSSGSPWRDDHARRDHALSHSTTSRDFATLVFAWKYGDLPGRSAPLELIGPPGIAALLERLAAAFGDWLREPGLPARRSREIAPGDAHRPRRRRRAARARRFRTRTESVAYSIERGGRRVVYTGDTGLRSDAGASGRAAATCCSASARCRRRWRSRRTSRPSSAARSPRRRCRSTWCSRTSIRPSSASTSARSSAPTTPARVTLADDGSTFEIEED